jgi:hypothetical protein
MTALCRYVAASCLASLRWVAPGLIFVLGLAVTYGPGGDPLSTLADGAIWLFPITAWLTVATLNDEDPSQAAITAVAAGSLARARAGKLLVAAGAGAFMTAVSLAAAFTNNSSSFTLNDLALGVVAHALTVIGGLALGSLCARPLISRTAWAVLVIVALTLVDVAIPYAPPARIVLVALNHAHIGQQWASLGIGVGEVIVLAALLIEASNYLSRVRS